MANTVIENGTSTGTNELADPRQTLLVTLDGATNSSLESNLSDVISVTVDANSKNAAYSGLECHVLDEYVLSQQPPSAAAETGETKDKKRGQNKHRPIFKQNNKERLCSYYVDVGAEDPEPECKYVGCRFQHNLAEYLSNKPPDLGESCYVYDSLGHCPRGVTCRFGATHLDSRGRNLRNPAVYTGIPQELNQTARDMHVRLRKKDYDFSLADTSCNRSFQILRQREGTKNGNTNDMAEDAEALSCDNDAKGAETEANDLIMDPAEKENLLIEAESSNSSEPAFKKPKLGPVSDADTIPLRPKEKKKLDWEDKLYLAPLTTVGNLPFRRLCKELGADITCSEMALALPLLQGHGPEWALLQRHRSEDFFGVQVCGCSPPQMSRVAQLIEDLVECDFVDINMGCPIDLIYKKGMGSGLMIRKRPLEIIARTMASVLSRPLTIKMRTGVFKDKNIAHTIFPQLEDVGVSALTIHGRSREQRYTKLADWDYIAECRKTVSLPVFGNGDILNYEDYYARKEASGVSGIMIARGALIKPWLFTEIKERRHWDISAQERLDIVKNYVHYGLEHWGSDDRGIENTRRFLLEWLSFAYRYVPYGILKYPPQRVNERLPLYKGRNELETLLASPDSRDWLKITEMFLGKVKPDFQFLPKHKANSYS